MGNSISVFTIKNSKIDNQIPMNNFANIFIEMFAKNISAWGKNIRA